MPPIRDDLLLAILTFVSVVCLGSAVLVTRAAHRRRVLARLRTHEGEYEEVPRREEDSQKRPGSIAAITRRFAAGRPSESLKATLARAGFHDPAAAAIYLGAKMLLLLGGTLGAAALLYPLQLEFSRHLLLALGAGMLLSFLPNVVVQVVRQKRTEEIRRHFPDAVDLLEICVSAGMGMDMAWNSVADEVRTVSSRLADEMALTNLEMHLGAVRTVALRHMVDRTGVEELGSLVAVLVQSEKFGTSIADALRVFAASMREARSQRAEEAAEKMAVKLLFPLIFFIFPPVMLVLIGPALIHLFSYFSKG